jgi:hypothetical protein
MLPLAIAFTLLTAQGQPPRLRTVLPNNSAILVEPMPNEKTISIQLWAASRGVEERPETHGLRHLMEHIMALGPNRDVDQRLETVGGTLRARTFRDATQIEIDVPASQLTLGLDVMSEMLKPIQVTPDQIATEAKIIDQEGGLREDDNLLNEAAWNRAYGQTALDPFGDIDVIRSATPADLEAVRKREFIASNLVLVVTGPVDLDGTTSQAGNLLGPLPKVDFVPRKERLDGLPGDTQATAYGEARAALVPGYASMRTVSALAAALAIGTQLDDCYVTYTPSLSNGLVILGRTDTNKGLESYIDGLDQAAMSGLYNRGKALAAGWVRRQMNSPSGIGYMRGMLLSQDLGARPETMLASIDSITYSQFVSGVNLFKIHNSISVEGSE